MSCAGIRSGNGIVYHSSESCGPGRQQKTQTKVSTEQESVPSSNVQNDLLCIAIWRKSTEGPDFVAPGKVKRVSSWLIRMTLRTALHPAP